MSSHNLQRSGSGSMACPTLHWLSAVLAALSAVACGTSGSLVGSEIGSCAELLEAEPRDWSDQTGATNDIWVACLSARTADQDSSDCADIEYYLVPAARLRNFLPHRRPRHAHPNSHWKCWSVAGSHPDLGHCLDSSDVEIVTAWAWCDGVLGEP